MSTAEVTSESRQQSTNQNAWQTNAKTLAADAVQNLLNRNDGMGEYGSNGPYTRKIHHEISEARTEEYTFTWWLDRLGSANWSCFRAPDLRIPSPARVRRLWRAQRFVPPVQ